MLPMGFKRDADCLLLLFFPVEQLHLHLQGLQQDHRSRRKSPAARGHWQRHSTVYYRWAGMKPTQIPAKATAGSSNKHQPVGVNSFSVH